MGFLQVSVQVPEERLGDFHQMFGNWLEQTQLQGVQKAPPEWSAADAERVPHMRTLLPKNSAALLDLLCKEGEMDVPLLVQRLGLKDPAQLNGVNGWVGRISNQFGRKSPITAKLIDGRPVWWVKPEVAALFK